MIDSKKLVEELENATEWLARDYYQECHSAAQLIRELEAKNAALKARVAELEAQNANLTCDMNAFRLRCESLQSQLAWTPVSAGLPTEPGMYAFGDPEQGNSSLVFWSLTGLTTTHRWWFSGTSYLSPLDHHHDVTHYRRIKLPKDGES